MLQWNELLFLLIVILRWEFSAFAGYSCGNKIEKSFTCRFDIKFQRKHNFGFCVILPEINKYHIPRISPILIIRTEYPVTQNPIIYMMNKISYI